MKRKLDFDLRVATDLGLKRKHVASVTSAFIQEVRNAISEDGVTYIDRLGRFLLRLERGGIRRVLTKGTFKKGQKRGTIVVEVPIRFRVHFTKAATFKKQLHEDHKEKM